MKPSRIRTGLLTLLTTALLCLGGTAQAQLEFFGKTTNLSGLSPTALLNLYNQIRNGSVYQVKISGTIDTTPISTDTGRGPVFGLNGAAVPLVAYVIVDTARSGPTVSLTEGAVVDGRNLLDDFVGYKGAQILAVYIRLGTEAGPKKEVGYLNYPGLTPLLPAPSLRSIDLGGSNAANLWLNGNLDSSVPDKGFFAVESTSGPSFLMQIGSTRGYLDPPRLDFDPSSFSYIQDGGSYAYGPITSVEVRDISASLSKYLGDRAGVQANYNKALLALKRAKTKTIKAKQAAQREYKRKKRRGGLSKRVTFPAFLKSYRPYKQVLAAQKRVQTRVNQLGRSLRMSLNTVIVPAS